MSNELVPWGPGRLRRRSRGNWIQAVIAVVGAMATTGLGIAFGGEAVVGGLGVTLSALGLLAWLLARKEVADADDYVAEQLFHERREMARRIQESERRAKEAEDRAERIMHDALRLKELLEFHSNTTAPTPGPKEEHNG